MSAPEQTDAQEIEFDLLAGWTEDAVRELGPEYAIPAGCRGSGSPSDLAWLAEALLIGPDTRVADVGSGVGGPAAWLADHFGPQPVCVEPMRGAAAAGRRLFGLPTVVAGAEALPLTSGAVRRGGVPRRAVHDPAAAATGGPAGAASGAPSPRATSACWCSSPAVPLPGPLPEGNDFPTEEALIALLDETGFTRRPDHGVRRARPGPGGLAGAGRRGGRRCWPAATATTRGGSGRRSRRRGSPG